MKRMKSNEVRQNWRDVLVEVEGGETIIIEHYNRPVARLVPFEENTMRFDADHPEVKEAMEADRLND